MEKLDYIIRTLTYARSKAELEQKQAMSAGAEDPYIKGKIDGLNLAISTVYSLIEPETDELN